MQSKLIIGWAMIFLSFSILSTSTPEGRVVAEETKKIFPPITLQAKAAYVLDVRTGEILFVKNENDRLPLASLTKLMGALVAHELTPPYTMIEISPEALSTIGENGLKAYERWNLKDLLDFSLITSSNDGLRAVALALESTKNLNFVNEMNRKARELGLVDTYFWNETGLDRSDVKSGSYGTARDMAMFLKHIITHQPELIEVTKETHASFLSLNNLRHDVRNTNLLTGAIPGLRASKTGFTNTAGGNLILAFDPELGRPIIIAVLGSTENGRFEDAKILIDATLEYLNEN